MGGYWQQVRGFGRDLHLFIAFNILANVGFGVFQVIYNLYLTKLGLHEDFIGAFSSVQTVAMAATAITMGTLLHRFGNWRCVTWGAVFFLAVSFALALIAQPALLLALAACYGVSQAFLFTLTMPCIIEWARREHRAHAAAVVFSLVALATTIGALLGGILPELISRPIPGIAVESMQAYRWTLVAGTVVAAFGVVPLLLMGAARQGKAAPAPTEPRPAEPVANRRQVRRDMAVFVTVGGLMALGAGMVLPFYNVFLTTLGANSQQVGYVYALGGLTAGVFGLTSPALGRRLGSLRADFILRISAVPAFALLLVFPTIWIAILAYLVRQTSAGMAWPLESTFISEVLPGRARTEVFGLRSGSWNFGIAGASLVAGWIIVQFGYGPTFGVMAVFSALAALLFVGYYGRHPLVRAGEVPSALPLSERTAAASRAQPEPEKPRQKRRVTGWGR